MAENKPIVGIRLKIARRAKELTQKELANIAQISQANVSYLESGRNMTTEDKVDALVSALDVNKAWLTGESDEGGVEINGESEVKRSRERDQLGVRWLEVFHRLRVLGIFKSDADFCDLTGVSRPSLSLVLSGKSRVSVDWVPLLEQFGGNRNYIYNNQLPLILSDKTKAIDNSNDVYENIKRLILNIEEDSKMLREMFAKLMP